MNHDYGSAASPFFKVPLRAVEKENKVLDPILFRSQTGGRLKVAYTPRTGVCTRKRHETPRARKQGLGKPGTLIPERPPWPMGARSSQYMSDETDMASSTRRTISRSLSLRICATCTRERYQPLRSFVDSVAFRASLAEHGHRVEIQT